MVDKIIRKCLASMGPDSIPSHCFFLFEKQGNCNVVAMDTLAS